jgi:hypothetical protein
MINLRKAKMERKLAKLEILSFLFLCVSCKTRDNSAAIKAASDTAPTLECETGETPLFFGMTAQENLPPIEKLGIPPSYTPGKPNRYDTKVNPNKTQRLDLCVNETEGTARLARIVFRGNEFLIFENWANPEVKGLETLVFENSPKDLDIKVETGPGDVGSVRGIVVKGFETGSYIYYGQKMNGTWAPYSNIIPAGSWEMGDPFADATCTAGETYGKSKFRLGSAQFSTEFCQHFNSDDTTHYRFIGLAISDSEQQLPSEERETVLKSAQEIAAVMKVKITHHNVCDSFHLQLNHREYWATSAGFMGEGIHLCPESQILAGAPVPPAGKFFKNMMYRVRNNGGSVIEGEATDCSHFLAGDCP